MKRKIYLLLIIIILTAEFGIIYFGSREQKDKMTVANKYTTTSQITEEIHEPIIENVLETDEDLKEPTEEVTTNEAIINEEVVENNEDIEDPEEIIEYQENNVSITSNYNENAFIDGYLKEYPGFRRKIWNFDN